MNRRRPLRAICATVATALASAPRTALADDAPDLSKLAGFIRWGGLVFALLAVAGAIVVLRVVSNLADRLGARFASRRPTIQKYESVARFIVYLATFAMVVSLSIRIDATTLTVIGGTLAFAVGFAMRDLMAAFIAGVTIMFDRPFQVGDRVLFAGQYGDVLKIGLRSTRILTLDHDVITVPNNKVLTEVTSSGNWGQLEMQTPFDFFIGADQDLDLAMELVREACLTSPYVYLEQPVPVLAKQVLLQNYVAIELKARPYVFDCKYEKAFETDVHMRVAKAFRAHRIHPPAMLVRTSNGDAHAPASHAAAS